MNNKKHNKTITIYMLAKKKLSKKIWREYLIDENLENNNDININ